MCAATGNDGDCKKGYRSWVLYLNRVFWLAGDSRLQQTFSLKIHLVERQSLSPICPSTIILLATGPLKPPLAPALAGLSPLLLYFR